MSPPARASREGKGRDRSAVAKADRSGARSSIAVRRRLDQGVTVLRSLVPLARRVSRIVGLYVVVVGAAAATIVTVLLWRFWPGSFADVVAHLLVAACLFAPVVMLWLFHRALAEVLGIPAQLSAVPDVARDHGSELAALVRDSQLRRGRLRLRSLPLDLWRAGRLLLAAHDDLPGYGAVLTLVNVPFLLASLASAIIGLVLILSAPAVLVGGALTAAL